MAIVHEQLVEVKIQSFKTTVKFKKKLSAYLNPNIISKIMKIKCLQFYMYLTVVY